MAAIFVCPPFGNFSLSNNGAPINVYDDLTVQYTTTWTSVNLTLFCAANITYSSWGFYNVLDNPLPPNGSYHIGTIQAASFNINSYPSICFLRLTKYGENDKSQAGNGFTITSDAKRSTTLTPPAQSASLPTTAVGSLTTTPTSTAAISTSTGLVTSSSSPVADSSTDLSTAAKVGIGLGVSIAALIFLALVLVISCMRGRRLLNARPRSGGEHQLSGAVAFHHDPTFSGSGHENIDGRPEQYGCDHKYELAGSEVHEMHDPEVRIPQLPD